MHAQTIQPRRAIVAEDDSEMRHLLADMLRQDNFDVTEAKDGTELLEQIRSLARRPSNSNDLPDVIISDVHMPGCTGIGAFRTLKALNLHIPMILVTAYQDPATHAEAHALGAAAVLDKPFDLSALRRAIRTLLRRPER